MTEAEWLVATNPTNMLFYLGNNLPRHLHHRRFKKRLCRLFGCACCRRMSNGANDVEVIRAIEIAEKIADGDPCGDERVAYFREAREYHRHHPSTDASAATAILLEHERYFDHTFADAVARSASRPGESKARTDDAPLSDEQLAQYHKQFEKLAEILRDIVGNPFRPPTLGKSWSARRADTAVKLAAAIYSKQEFESVRLLADALEDAACTDAEVLGHLRGPGPHVRGCWAVDLVLATAGERLPTGKRLLITQPPRSPNQTPQPQIPTATTMPVAAIRVGYPVRREFGDLEALARSIEVHGIRQPLVVRSDGELLAGERRLLAVKSLGWKDVAVYVVNGLDDGLQIISSGDFEAGERLPYTPSEHVAVGLRVEELLGGGTSRLTRKQCQLIGARISMGGTLYERARELVLAAASNPDRYGGLVRQMDAERRLSPRVRQQFQTLREAEEGV
jgi:hypothetical protein